MIVLNVHHNKHDYYVPNRWYINTSILLIMNIINMFTTESKMTGIVTKLGLKMNPLLCYLSFVNIRTNFIEFVNKQTLFSIDNLKNNCINISQKDITLISTFVECMAFEILRHNKNCGDNKPGTTN